MSALNQHLQRLHCLFVGGPGGVGKSLVSGALAWRAASLGRPVRWLTTQSGIAPPDDLPANLSVETLPASSAASDWERLDLAIDHLLAADTRLLIIDPAPLASLLRLLGIGPALVGSPGFIRLNAQPGAELARLPQALETLGNPGLAALALVCLPRPRPQREAVRQARLAHEFGLPLAGTIANMSTPGEAWPPELAPPLAWLPLGDENLAGPDLWRWAAGSLQDIL